MVKRESGWEKAARLSKVSSEANRKLDLHIAIASIKACPEALSSCKHHMVSNGWWLSEVEIKALQETSRRDDKGEGDDADSGVDTAEGPLAFQDRKELQIEVHRNFATWSRVPPAHLTLVLAAIEEVSMSAAALKGLRKKGQREVPSSKLLELLERETGCDPMSQIGPRRFLWQLAEDLSKRSLAEGRPLQFVQLPAKWNGDDGVYKLLELSGVLYIQSKSGRAKLLYDDVQTRLLSDLRIENNFSVQRACVKSRLDTTISPNCLLLLLKGAKEGLEIVEMRKPVSQPGPRMASSSSCLMDTITKSIRDDQGARDQEPEREADAREVGQRATLGDTQGDAKAHLSRLSADKDLDLMDGGLGIAKGSPPQNVKTGCGLSAVSGEATYRPPLPGALKRRRVTTGENLSAE
jgi:hypothetical protein